MELGRIRENLGEGWIDVEVGASDFSFVKKVGGAELVEVAGGGNAGDFEVFLEDVAAEVESAGMSSRCSLTR